MGLLESFTGGQSEEAQRAARRAEDELAGVSTPSISALTLPQLQEYVNAGVMTPEQAQAYMQQSNAYASENTPQQGTEAMVQALGQLSDVSDAGPMGTPMEQAQIGSAIDQANQSTAGQRGAIEQQMAAKGTPAAMLQAALSTQYQGQDAQQAHRDSLQAQGQAYQQAVSALAEKGQLGGQLQGQQNTQANTVAGAQNAMQQFNAANQQAASAQNAGLRQQAGLVNTATAQDVANKNTSTTNARTEYNASVPQTVFQDQLAKATGQANAATKTAEIATGQGQQNAGIYSGLIGTGAQLVGDYYTGGALSAAQAANKKAHGGILSNHDGCYHDGGICMDDGGMVPGEPQVQGDSLKNDTVPVMASPGEAVIPRTAVQQHLPEVLGMISEARGGGNDAGHHPQDVASLLQALKAIRMGAA